MTSGVVIVEFVLPPSQVVRLQSILMGEDGLATIRCLDPEKRKQQFWTTQEQLPDLYEWVHSLPGSIGLEILDEWLWQEEKEEESI